jgi:hypothetical protein
MPAGWGVPRDVAEARKDGLARLVASIPRGEGPVILSAEDAALRRAREQQSNALSLSRTPVSHVGLVDGGILVVGKASTGLPAVQSKAAPVCGSAPIDASGVPPAAAAVSLEAPRVRSEELFVRKISAGSVLYTHGMTSQVAPRTELPLTPADDAALCIRYTALPDELSANLWANSGMLASIPASSLARASLGIGVTGTSWLQGRYARTAKPAGVTSQNRMQQRHALACMCCGSRRAAQKVTMADTGPGSDVTEDECEEGAASPEPSRDTLLAPRAWAACSSCPNLICFPCLFPSPAAAGMDSPTALSAFLEQAAASSEQNLASSVMGSTQATSDAGLWVCPPCAVSRGGGWSLPWCGICHTSVADKVTTPDDSFFGCLASPVDFVSWPSVVRCDICNCKMHAPCAARSGTVVVERSRHEHAVRGSASQGHPGLSQSHSSALVAVASDGSSTSSALKSSVSRPLSGGAVSGGVNVSFGLPAAESARSPDVLVGTSACSSNNAKSAFLCRQCACSVGIGTMQSPGSSLTLGRGPTSHQVQAGGASFQAQPQVCMQHTRSAPVYHFAELSRESSCTCKLV